MQKTSTSGNYNSKRIYRALRNHRHAVSDPGFDKIPPGRYFNIPSALQSSYDTMSLSNEHHLPAMDSNKNNISVSSDHDGKKRNKGPEAGPEQSTPSRTTDCACQTPDEKWLLNDINDEQNIAAHQCRRSPSSNALLQTAGIRTDPIRHHAEADSPSEGYHSQQSSGSPTPNTERSSVHFPGECVSPSLRDVTQSNVFRRNRSNEVLTSLNV